MREGGELGYSMVHAFGAAFDNPDLIVACIIGDGESAHLHLGKRS
jgi:xylulose-5-phosphate/fructose-6-phosphate phosphoketolase